MDKVAYFDRILAGMGYVRGTARLPMVRIDPNVRFNGSQTLADPEDFEGEIVIGSRVRVYEPESGLIGDGVAADFDEDRQLLILDVDWSSLRPTTAADEELPLEA